MDIKVTEDMYEEFGRVGISFNNMGVIKRKDIIELNEEEWDFLGVSLKAIYLLSRQVISYMIKSGRGNIINIGSGWRLKGGLNTAA